MLWEYSTYSKIDSEVSKYFPFDKARENQLETISEIKEAIDNGYKYIILEAGTGTGKSAIATTLSLMYDSAYILTVTKQLQEQYLNDFSSLGFKLVKGRGNFECKKYLEDAIEKNCDEGRCVIEGHHCEYSIKNTLINKISKEYSCHYDYQKWVALNADVVISNYPYLFLELNYVEDFKKRKLMIFDEAHNLENTIMNQLKLEFKRSELKDNIGINLSKEVVDELTDGDYTTWIKFIRRVVDRYGEELNKIKNIKDKPELREKLNYYKHRIEDCYNFMKHIKSDPHMWMFDYDSKFKVAEFKPIKVENYAKNTFFKYGDVCLFMSATILDYKLFSEWLGINEDEVYAIRQKSPFAINRNPIVVSSDYNMSFYKLSQTAPLTIKPIEEILEKHKHEKGIIHTISYQCKNFLKKNVESSRFIDHDTRNRARQLERFKNSNEALVLISPSMNEGVDLPGNLCRFQIIYKVPYPSLGDKQTKIRKSIDSQWYDYKTALALVQTVGRGMRYEKDYCTTYFMDNRLYDFVIRDSGKNDFLPDTFIKAINIEPAEIDEQEDVFKEVPLIREDLKGLIDKSKFNFNDLNWDFDSENKSESIDDLVDNYSGVEEISEDSEKIYVEDTFNKNIDLKIELYNKGKKLLKNNEITEAIVFYKDLINHELFINDYHPYLKLSQAYHENAMYNDEVKIIEEFFQSGRYCRNSTIKWFKKKLSNLDKMGYYDISQFDNLNKEYKRNGGKNRKLTTIPVPLAGDIKSCRKNLNKKPVSINFNIYKNEVKVPDNLSYDEKIDFKYNLILKGKNLMETKHYDKAIVFYTTLINHELFINDYHPYYKLSKCYGKTNRYDKQIECISNFFKSGIYAPKKIIKSFKSNLKGLNRNGYYDFSLFDALENIYSNNGALNDYKSDKPILKSIKIIKSKENGENILTDDEKDYEIKHSNEYSRNYFNKLAKEIQNNPDFVSDREISQHDEEDFIEITENYEQINEKADLINKGKRLESEDKEKAINFYHTLKYHKLFEYDYYPYRRQCILFKNKIKDDQRDLDTIIELFNHEIFCNPHQYIWLHNKLLELIDKLDLNDDKINEIDVLLKNYGKNEEKYYQIQNNNVPIAERIIKDENGLRLLSQEKYDFVQDVYYIKELGVGYIRRGEYETAISYYLNLLQSDILYYKYHAYKQLGRIYNEMSNPSEFKRLYEKLSDF